MWLKVIAVSIVGTLLYYHYSDVPLPMDLTHDSSNLWFKLEKQTIGLVVKAATSLGFDRAKVFRSTLEFVQSKLQYTDDSIQVKDAILDGISVRIFTPKSKSSSKLRSGILYFHGGGWVVGSRGYMSGLVFSWDLIQSLSQEKTSPEIYRLSPEHIFPAAYDDCLKVTRHLLINAENYGIDMNRIALAGDSAGGNLAATVSLGLRDSHPDLKAKLQILITPVTQCADFQLPSYQQNDKLTGYFLSTNIMVYFCMSYALGAHDSDIIEAALQNRISSSLFKKEVRFRDYLATKHISKYLFPRSFNETQGKPLTDSKTISKLLSQVTNPYMSPLFARNLQNLPEAYVTIAEYDVLRDDAILYIRRLKEAGVKVTEGYHKTVHVAAVFTAPGLSYVTLTDGDIAYKDLIKFIKQKL